MSQTTANLVDHVVPHVPVRQWVLSLPIPLRVLLTAQPELVACVPQVVQGVVTRHRLDGAGFNADEGPGGAVTLIQRVGSAANLNIHLRCLVLVGMHRCGADGAPSVFEVAAPSDDDLHALLLTVTARLMKMLTRTRRAGRGHGADPPGQARRRRRRRGGAHAAWLQAAAVTYRIAFGPRAGQEVLTLRGAMPREDQARQPLCADIGGFSLHATVRVSSHNHWRSLS